MHHDYLTNGSYTARCEAKNELTRTAVGGRDLVVFCPAIGVTPATLTSPVTTGIAYSQSVAAAGGQAPYTFSVLSGSLPTGLSLNPTTGEISGTPTAAGNFSFTIEAIDDNGCVGSQPYSIEVDCATITLSAGPLPDGTTGVAYSQTVTASGSTGTYTYSVSAGSLPTGLTLNTSTGEISGTPSATGTFNFSIEALDTYGCTGSDDYSITINCDSVSVTPATLPDGATDVAYTGDVDATGGTAPYLFTISAGSLPPGLTIDSSTGIISGTPTTAGAFNFTVSAADSFGCANSQAYSVNITQTCLFCDDFDDDSLDPNWTYTNASNWSEAGTNLIGVSTKKTTAIAQPIFTGCLNCTVTAEMQTAGGNGNVLSLFGWYVDKKNNVELMLKEEANKVVLRQRVNNSVVKKQSAAVTIDPNTTYEIKVSFNGTQFEVFVDGLSKMTFTSGRPCAVGKRRIPGKENHRDLRFNRRSVEMLIQGDGASPRPLFPLDRDSLWKHAGGDAGALVSGGFALRECGFSCWRRTRRSCRKQSSRFLPALRQRESGLPFA